MTRVTHIARKRGGVNASLELGRIRLIGDDAQGTGLCAGAEQRALWSRQCFHARDIHHANVRLIADSGD